MGRYVPGWFVVTAVYFLTLYGAATSYTAITNIPIDHQRDQSGLVLGMFVVTVPYLVGGIYAAIADSRSIRSAFWVSIVPAISEKILVLLIGAAFVAGGGDGGGDGIVTWESVIGFIRAEAIPYFTPFYIVAGSVFSVLVCIGSAVLTGKRRSVYRQT